MAIRVMLLTQWFDPEPTFKGLSFARELKKKGYEIEVVTGFPNYPTGNVYPGYNLHLIKREVVDDINITRLYLYPSHDASVIKRITNYLSFGVTSLIYVLFFAKKSDVIYAYHPPLTVGIVASLIRIFRRIPVVYDIQDMWPDTLRATGMLNNEKILSIISKVCNWVYRKVDRIVVLSPGFKKLLIKRGVPENKIEVIYNWCEEDVLNNRSSICTNKFPGPERFRIVFAGNMGKAQALDSIISVAEKLEQIRPNICFVLVGSGVEVDNLKNQVKLKKLNNVVFIPRVPMSEVGAILNSADALFLHLKDDPLFAITIPSKTQAYMAVGKPILMAVRGDAANLVSEAGCGVTAIPEDQKSILEAALKLADLPESERNLMAKRASTFYHDKLSIAVNVEKFSEQFQNLTQR